MLLAHRERVLAEQLRISRSLAVVDQKIKDHRLRLSHPSSAAVLA